MDFFHQFIDFHRTCGNFIVNNIPIGTRILFQKMNFSFKLQKIGGLGCAIGCYLELMVVCYLGNNVKNTKMNIAMEFYKIRWYQMPATYQKLWICAIHDAQNGASLTMGPLGELDFQMASSVSEILS